MRVLIVEDDRQLAAVIATGLRESRIETAVAHSFGEASRKAALARHSVIILDVSLPGGSGYELCRRLRARGDATPILMLTARGGVEDRVAGLDAGADDYLPKPFHFKELVARVRALARRPPALRGDRVRIGDLSVDLRTREVVRAGRPIPLTAREWALLEVLVDHRGGVASRQEITERVWDENHDPFSNALEVLVLRLRRKIDDGFDPPLIQTVRGAGYRLVS